MINSHSLLRFKIIQKLILCVRESSWRSFINRKLTSSVVKQRLKIKYQLQQRKAIHNSFQNRFLADRVLKYSRIMLFLKQQIFYLHIRVLLTAMNKLSLRLSASSIKGDSRTCKIENITFSATHKSQKRIRSSGLFQENMQNNKPDRYSDCQKAQRHRAWSGTMHQYTQNRKISQVVLDSFNSLIQDQQIKIQRSQELVDLVSMLMTFNLPLKQITRQIIADIIAQRNNYDFFTLFSLSSILKLRFIKDQCLHELILDNFEQFNYNMYELLSCPQSIFEQLIKYHQAQVAIAPHLGLQPHKLRSLIREYQEINGIDSLISNLVYGCEAIQEEEQEDNQCADYNTNVMKWQFKEQVLQN